MKPFAYRRAGRRRRGRRAGRRPTRTPCSSPAAPTSSTTSSSASRRPDLLVDVRAPAARPTIERRCPDGGAAHRRRVRNSDLAAHRRVRARYPVLAQALLAGASGQLRNLATTGGNLLQRTRCVYFQDVTTPVQQARARHRLLGARRATAATTHPRRVRALRRHPPLRHGGRPGRARRRGRGARRRTASAASRSSTCTGCPATGPTATPSSPTASWSPPSSCRRCRAARRSTYRKVRDRASYAFALVSVAARLDVDGDGRRRPDRLGGVAHKPWRATPRRGGPARAAGWPRRPSARPPTPSCAARQPHRRGNAFKVPMVRSTIVATLRDLAEGAAR